MIGPMAGGSFRARRLWPWLVLTTIVLCPACQGPPVDHTTDVMQLLVDTDAPDPDRGFRPIGEDEKVHFDIPEMEPYRIGIGDVLNVSVPGQEQFVGLGETSTGELVGVRVKEDGQVYLPQIRKVPAQGKTVVELQDAIAEKLQDYVREPFVSVDVLSFESQKFYMLGEVVQPGALPVDGRTTLLQGITMAGGTNNGAADLEAAYVIRGGEALPISLADVIKRGDLAGNLVLQDRDVVFVPHVRDRRDFIYVFGEVGSPAAVPMEHEGATGTVGSLTLAAALAQVGGLNPGKADQNQIRVFRGGWQTPRAFTLGAHELYKYGDNIYLQPGDRIYVAPTGMATWRYALGDVLPLLSSATSVAALATSLAALSR